MLQKQAVPINFTQGLDTKTDPWQVPLGKFLFLQNSIFTKGGLLQKRNGFGQLGDLPNATYKYLTTLNENLTALGPKVSTYSSSQDKWIEKDEIAPLTLGTLPLVRNGVNQVQADTAISDNGLICTVYTEENSGVTKTKFCIADVITGQNIVEPQLISIPSGTVEPSARVFYIGTHFVIVFTRNTGIAYELKYIAINSLDTTAVTTAQNISTNYAPATTVAWDGVVVDSKLYLAYNTTSGGQAIKYTYLTSQAAAQGQPPVTAQILSGEIATMISLCVDISNSTTPIIYISYYDSVSKNGYIAAWYLNLTLTFLPTQIINALDVLNITAAATGGVCTVFYEEDNSYGYNLSIPTHFVSKLQVTVAGVVGSASVLVRSVGLASKAFIYNSLPYVLTAYESTYQSTYFLIDGASTEATPKPIAKLAYQNGGGYVTLGLPSVTIYQGVYYFSYLIKDFIAAETTVTATPVANPIAGVYSQTGVNLASIIFDTGYDVARIANNLHISGGYLWQFDGVQAVEQNFFLYPDNVEATWSAVGGSIVAKPDGLTNTDAYFYQVCYEWEDNQGLVYRSTPSLPIAVTTTGAGNTGSITIDIPYLRLTRKIANKAKIVVYRWSVGQQVFHRVTSLTAVQLNDTTADYITITDTLADSSIVGNDILYTTGGVVPDINPPASNLMTLFDTRMWMVDAENRNLLWFSKQIIPATPVEMSDLLTYYVPPSTGAQGSTGPITAIAPMDDKLIIFKANAIYYINGVGPDNTGANNGYSQPIFITSTVGCIDQASIVFMPQGLMFKSNKGIWLLQRDLQTAYIGAPVEAYNDANITSAVNIPKENQVRMTLDNGLTLMYDYFYQQWGTFNITGISSVTYNDVHVLITNQGKVFKETPGVYFDGTNPVLMSFKTSWVNLAGLQGYQRAYFFYMLGKYYTPHKLFIQVGYDYEENPSHEHVFQPNNYSAPYGGTGSDDQSPYGQQQFYGGPGNVEQFRVFLKQQRCQAFQIYFNEIFDPSYNTKAGAGLTLSGLDLIVGLKKGYRPIAARSSGGTN